MTSILFILFFYTAVLFIVSKIIIKIESFPDRNDKFYKEKIVEGYKRLKFQMFLSQVITIIIVIIGLVIVIYLI